MAINLNAVRDRLKSLQSTNTGRKLQWKPEPGKTTIRIVPYAFNKDNPFLELFFHYNVGKKSYLSLATFGETDPIVEFSEKLKQTGSKEDWLLGRKLEPTLRTFVPIIVRGKEQEGVKFWGFGKTVYQELLAIIADPDYGDITDPKTGRDILVEYQTPAEAGNTYGKMSIRVKPNQTPCTDDKGVMDMIINGQVEIYEVHKKSSYDELKTALENWLDPDNAEHNEDTGNEDVSLSNSADEEDIPQQPAAPSSVKKVEDVTKAFDELFKKK